MPNPSKGEKRKDFLSRCMGDSEARGSFPNQDQRYAFCNSQWNRRGHNVSESVTEFFAPVQLEAAAGREENFLGRQFRVFPAVLVRSQILHNNLGVCYLPAEDITEEWAAQWNGIPVLIGAHPSDAEGTPTSGRTVDQWDERLAGYIFNAKVKQEDENTRALVGEIWFDMERVDQVRGFQSVLDEVSNGNAVELSTGFITEVVPMVGNYKGEAFQMVMHPDKPDHLVISTEFTGACSCADGCGLGVNKFEGEQPVATPKTKRAESGQRAESRPSMWERIKAKFSTQRSEADSEIQAKFAQDEAYRTSTNQAPVSDDDKRRALQAALTERFKDAGEAIITDVYSADSMVVFWLVTPFGPQPKGPQYFRLSYSEGEGGSFTFAEGDPEKVQRVTVYEPVGNTAGEQSPATATNCSCGSQQEEATMSDKNKEQPTVEAQLASIASAVETLSKTVGNLATEVGGLKKAAETDPNPSIAGLKRTIGELAEKVEGMATVTQTAVQEKERERKALVEALAGNYRCSFTEAELEAKPLSELQKLAEMLSTSFSGKGGSRAANVADRNEQTFAEPQPYWLVKDEKTGKGGH